VRHMLHDEAERRQVVRRGHRIRIAEIDLVLCVRHLVVRRLHLEAHQLEYVHHRTTGFLAAIRRRQVEIAPHVVRVGADAALAVRHKQEELGLHAGVHRVAQVLGTPDHALQHPARITRKRRAVRHVDVADEPTHARILIAPGKIRNVEKSGASSMSDSSMRTNPSIDEPSNMMSPANALANCEAGISTFLFTPRMSVNCRRIERTLFLRARSRMSFADAPRTSGVIEREVTRGNLHCTVTCD